MDIYIQKIFGYDIFGVQLETSGEGRVSALFGKEYIAGSYLARLFPILVLLFFFINQKKIIINENIYVFILVVIFGTSIFITLERTSFLMFLISLFSLIFITQNYKLYLKYIIFFFLILFFFSANDQKIKNRYNDLVNSFYSKNQKQIIISSGHIAHIQTAYIMFLDNPFFGVGLKNYRVHCQKPQFFRFYVENNTCKIENNTCTTHPHNIPFQFLSETGFLGFFFYFFSILYLTKNFFFLNKNSCKTTYYLKLMTLPLLINLFPLMASGNFFHNWLSVLTYLPLGLYFLSFKKN
jgi:O-antigen ligase